MARPSQHMSKCHIVGNHMSRLNSIVQFDLATAKSVQSVAL